MKIVLISSMSFMIWRNGLLVKAMDSPSRDPGFTTTRWVSGRLSLSLFGGRSNVYQELPEMCTRNSPKCVLGTPRNVYQELPEMCTRNSLKCVLGTPRSVYQELPETHLFKVNSLFVVALHLETAQPYLFRGVMKFLI